MAFKEIQKGVVRRFTRLKNTTEFSQSVTTIIHSLYPSKLRSKLISRIVHEPVRRRLCIQTASPAIARRFLSDKGRIRAVLRREGFDIREIVIR